MSLFNRIVVKALPLIPKTFVGMVAKTYIAGETAKEALDVAAMLNKKGFLTTIDLVGENVKSMDEAQDAAKTYELLLDEISRRGIDSNISIKPSQFGLRINKEACCDLIKCLLDKARSHENFVRIEMEDSTCTSDTIALFLSVKNVFKNTGIVLQSYLHRSKDDVRDILGGPLNVRIVKGAYVEPLKISYKDPEIINENYVHLAEFLLRNGVYVAFATHDEILVGKLIGLVNRLGLPSSAYEFQMLLGVHEKLRNVIRDAGQRIRIYIPFGENWYPYSVRRLRENPKIAKYVIQAMFDRN